MTYQVDLFINNNWAPTVSLTVGEGEAEPSGRAWRDWRNSKNEFGFYEISDYEVAWFQPDQEPDGETFVFAAKQLWGNYVARYPQHALSLAVAFYELAKQHFGDEGARSVMEEAIPRQTVANCIEAEARKLHSQWLDAVKLGDDLMASDYLRPRKAPSANPNATGSSSEPK